jgi:hippurate hydrolase
MKALITTPETWRRATRVLTILGLCAGTALGSAELPAIQAAIDAEFASLEALYQELHRNPELSFHEKETAVRMANELRACGFEVTEGLGGHGVAGVLRNGEGPTVLVRADMDALPIEEETGLPYASKARGTDDGGASVPVMHACGHDIHMTVFVGTARILARFKSRWSGTAVLIAQPAEERGSGARMMLRAGLYERFPRPDLCLALHVKADMPAGRVGTIPGYALANVDMVDITLSGVGGHGAWPHTTKDPVVLAAQAILAYQTIVSRETEPGQAAVVTVGSIHGGTKHNIIPDNVALQLTLRSFTDEVRSNTLASIRRITENLALAAGVPTNRLPVIRVRDEFTPALYNDPSLVERLHRVFTERLGSNRVQRVKPVMGGEDFGVFGRTGHQVPICLFWLGAADPARFEGEPSEPLPGLHSSRFAPAAEPTIKTGVLAMTSAVLDVFARGAGSPAH